MDGDNRVLLRLRQPGLLSRLHADAGLAQRTGATLVYRPMLLGGVFKATGNQSPIEIPAKGAWMMTDLPRFATRYGVPYVRNPHFPINTLNLMRGAVAAEMEGRLIPYQRRDLPRDLGRPETDGRSDRDRRGAARGGLRSRRHDGGDRDAGR